MPRRTQSEEMLLAALAAGTPVEQAAAAAGLSVRTAYRRLADPAFRGRLARARDALIETALGELVDSASHAVATLGALLASPDERVRLGAAKAVLEQLLRLRETVGLGQRVAALERAQVRQAGGRR
jgi:hypothetical protein